MAMTTVNPRYEGFIFDGENSRDYGIYVQDVKVFGAPTRDVEMVSIPGRDGEFVLDKGRFNNIQVVYTCALGTDTQTDFNTGVSDFRNWLASRKGYKRLEDEINTTEYRMAVFKDGLDVSTLNKETGTFEVAFDCKPQRFLKSGEEPTEIGGEPRNPRTYSGAVATFEGTETDVIPSLKVAITPQQAGSGDPSPSNVRPISGTSTANVFVTGENLRGGETMADTLVEAFRAKGLGDYYCAKGEDANGKYVTARANTYSPILLDKFKPNTRYTVILKMKKDNAGASTNLYVKYTDGTEKSIARPSQAVDTVETFAFTSAQGKSIAYIASGNYSGVSTLYYENCGIFEGVLTTADYVPYTGHTTPVPLGQTVYGGELDVATGVLTLTHGMKYYDGTATPYDVATNFGTGYNRASYLNTQSEAKRGTAYTIMSDKFAYSNSYYLGLYKAHINENGVLLLGIPDTITSVAQMKTWAGQNPFTVVYELATPTTVQLTPTQVATLLGTNNVWSDAGEVTVTVADNPNMIVNPTLFDSHPLLEVDGYGTISINGEEVVLHNEPLGRVQLGGGTSYAYSVSYQFDQSQFNTGDFITVPDYRKTFQIDMVKPYGSGEIIDFQMTSMTAPDYIFNATKYQGTLTLLTDASIFSVGTARTDSYNVVGKISYKNSSGTASEADFTAGTRVVYNGNGAVSFTAYWYAEDTDFHKTAVYDNAPNFYGDSTWQPVTDTAYIDLDIGEAYVIQDGNMIGINNITDLPAELPTLDAGANSISYDNTVTSLNIVPRWWKV